MIAWHESSEASPWKQGSRAHESQAGKRGLFELPRVPIDFTISFVAAIVIRDPLFR
jgi:hypothetical protein